MSDESSSAAGRTHKAANKGKGQLTTTDMGLVNSRAKQAGHGLGTNVSSSASTAKPKGKMLKKK